jgi:hypothetical protein
MVQIDLTNLSQIFMLGFATAFGTVLATKIATKVLEFLEAKTKLTLKEMQRFIEQKRNNHQDS